MMIAWEGKINIKSLSVWWWSHWPYKTTPVMEGTLCVCAGHGTNVDGVWIRAHEPRQLPKGIKFKLAASTREYKVSPKGVI